MSLLYGLLPVATCVAWTLAAQRLRSRGFPASLRLSAVLACILLSAAILGITEILSLLHTLSFWPVLGFWLIALALPMPLALRSWSVVRPRLMRLAAGSRVEQITSALVLFVLAVSLYVACVYPPQTFDTLTYHLPRQIMWWQQGSVEHYDSANYRSLSMTPFVEYVGLHLFGLTRTDFWHTGVQWVYLAAGLCAITLLVRRLGGSRLAQWFAALFVVTYPVVFFEATSAKNDVVAAVFIVMMLLLTLAPPRVLTRLAWCALIGVTLGLALMTKGSTYLFGAPVVLWLIWRLWRACGLRGVTRITVVFAIAVLLNLGYWGRNEATFGRIFGPAGGAENAILVNQSHAPLQMLSVTIRNLASLSVTPSDSINRAMQGAVESVHQLMRVSVSDPATTFNESFVLAGNFRSEDSMTSLFHNILVLAGLIMVFLAWRNRRPALGIGLCVVVGFAFFCIYLKWQLWLVRLVLPAFFMAAPLAALAIVRWRRGNSFVIYATATLLFVSLLPAFKGPRPVFSARPWTEPRDVLVLGKNRRTEAMNARVVAEKIAALPNIRTVGIAGAGPNTPCYALMLPIVQCNPHPVQLRFLNPRVTISRAVRPECDVVIGYGNESVVIDSATGKRFIADATFSPFTLYLPSGKSE